MTEQSVFTVSELTSEIRTLLESSYPSVTVKGEISNFKHHGSGHMYFTLKDTGAELSAVMFRGNNQYLTFSPKDGLDVQVTGRITVFEKRGSYQIVVQRMEQSGIGALYQAFEELKKKLSAEGLFDKDSKQLLPNYPKKVGVITSATGAAVRDIFQVMERRCPHVDIVLRPSLVQGPGAAADIVKAIDELNNQTDVDVIILGRGGGSIEDLWPFNEEVVARSIFASVIPIVSAVGHETDVTIADFVSDVRAPTPSAAAEIVSASRDEIIDALKRWMSQAQRRLSMDVQMKWQASDHSRERLISLNPAQSVLRYREKCQSLSSQIYQSISTRLESHGIFLAGIIEKLGALNPESILNRGYSIARTIPEGQIIKSARDIKVGRTFTLQTGDGEIRGKRIQDEGTQTTLPFEP